MGVIDGPSLRKRERERIKASQNLTYTPGLVGNLDGWMDNLERKTCEDSNLSEP